MVPIRYFLAVLVHWQKEKQYFGGRLRLPYPNPAKDDINLYAENVTSGHYTAQVYTSTGLLVLNKVADISATAQHIQLPAAQLSSGNYRVIVFNANGENIYQHNITLVR